MESLKTRVVGKKYIFAMALILTLPSIASAISPQKPECEACIQTFTTAIQNCVTTCRNTHSPDTRPACGDQCVEEHGLNLKQCFGEKRCPLDRYQVPDLEAFRAALRQPFLLYR